MTQRAEDILKSWTPEAGRQIHYCLNPGNAGDALIAAATWQAFDRIGLRPLAVRPGDIPPDASLILGGGGNLIPYYSNIKGALELSLARNVRRCILLSHTIRGNEELLRRLDERFTLLCRDIPSLEHVRSYAPRARSILAYDMATFLDIPRLEKRTATIRHRLALLFDKDWQCQRKRWQAALSRCHTDSNGRLAVLRSDCETAAAEPRDPALDLPAHYHIKRTHRAGAEQVSMDLINLLRRACCVRTDRLHIALPAALLGLPVELLDNNYGKLSAVWDVSIRGRSVC